MLQRVIGSARSHWRTINRDILSEPLNRGHRAALLTDYFRWQLFHKFVNRRWTISLENGFKSIVYPYPDHDAGEAHIWTRNVDAHDTRLVRSVLRKGDVIVDAGCNIGNRTLAIADLLGGALLIDAGEVAARRTSENLQLNKLHPDTFVVIRKAVGNRIGMVRFTDHGGASTVNTITENAESGVATVEVPLTTIDAEVERYGRLPSFIKIDVEGQDFAAIEGAAATIRSGAVRLIKFERNQTEALQPFLTFFQGLGWTVFALDANGRISHNDDLISRNMNLFAAPSLQLEALKAKSLAA